MRPVNFWFLGTGLLRVPITTEAGEILVNISTGVDIGKVGSYNKI